MRDPPPIVARELPFARRDVLVDGVRVSVVDDGPRAAPAVVFVHGNPTWSFLWRRLIRAARGAGLRAVAPDHVGFGFSEKLQDADYYTPERHAENLRVVLASLELRDPIFVVHDWGGPIGLAAAMRLATPPAGLVVTNTAVFPPRKARSLTPWHSFFASRFGYRNAIRFPVLARSALRFGVRRPLGREVRAAYLWPMQQRGGRVAAAEFVRRVPDSPDHPTSAFLSNLVGKLSSYRGPVRVLWADADPVFPPRTSARWTELFSAAQVRHVANAGHFWQEDDPEPFAQFMLEFDSEVRNARAGKEDGSPREARLELNMKTAIGSGAGPLV